MTTKIQTQKAGGLDRASLLRVHRLMVLSRTLDEVELRLRRQQKTFFQIAGAGHEAVLAAAALLLKPGYDWFYPYYRDRALVLGLGFSPVDMLLQALGKATDPSTGGREMPCHFGSPELHIVNQSSPTGTQYLQAVGTAEAGKIAAAELEARRSAQSFDAGQRARRRDADGTTELPPFGYDELVYVSGGEGSTSGGEFYEALCAACSRRLPLLFLIEDNKYAISVPVEVQTPGGKVSALLGSFPNLLVDEVDGLDPIESHRVLRRAVTHVRSGAGPALVHAHVLRLQPHSASDDDGAYRPRSEKEADCARDPIPRFEERLVQEGYLPAEEVQAIHAAVRREVEDAVTAASREPDPDPTTATRYLFNPRLTPAVEVKPQEEGPLLTMVEAINRTLEAEMRRDPRVVIMGEDVADVSRTEYLDEVKGKGGVFKVTHNLQRKFGDHRVFNTPIAEAGVVGRAIGLAVRGFIPVAEIQFVDYIWPAMHQIRNELSIMRWRSNNTFSAPVVLRVPIGGYLVGGGPYHSQCGESIFCHCPGLRVVLPSCARDAVGLLRTAIRCGDPVLFFEHKHLYRQGYARSPDPGPDFVLPFGKAQIVRPGRHATVITYGALVHKSLRAAEALSAEGVEVEVMDLRTLVPYDWDAICDSVRRTSRVVVAYEDNRTHGFGAELAARIGEELFAHLDSPVARVAALDVPVAYSPVLEEATLPQVADIVAAVQKVREY